MTSPVIGGGTVVGGGGKGWWSKFLEMEKNAGHWIYDGILDVNCWIYKAKIFFDEGKLPDKVDCPQPSQKVQEEHEKTWQTVFNVFFILLGLVVGALVLWYIFPAFSIFGEVVSWMYDLTTYLFTALDSLVGIWYWFYNVINGWTDSLQKSLGGSPTLWWLLGMELILLSLSWVFAGVMGIYHVLLDTPIQKVFGILNTPFRWIRIQVLQRFFGKNLGNILSLIELPLEAMVFLISLPISLIYWAFQKLAKGK